MHTFAIQYTVEGYNSAPGLWSYEKLLLKSFPENLEQFVQGFGQDLSGEIYVVTSKQLGPTGIQVRFIRSWLRKKIITNPVTIAIT